MTTPETATCACSHKISDHQSVTRYPPTLRKQKSRLRQGVKPVQRREHCLRCDCRFPK